MPSLGVGLRGPHLALLVLQRYLLIAQLELLSAQIPVRLRELPLVSVDRDPRWLTCAEASSEKQQNGEPRSSEQPTGSARDWPGSRKEESLVAGGDRL